MPCLNDKLGGVLRQDCNFAATDRRSAQELLLFCAVLRLVPDVGVMLTEKTETEQHKPMKELLEIYYKGFAC
jgi:hypothetical protein